MVVEMSVFDWTAITLLIAGGLNWGLVALFKFDLVKAISMKNKMVDKGIKALVGVAALYSIISFAFII